MHPITSNRTLDKLHLVLLSNVLSAWMDHSTGFFYDCVVGLSALLCLGTQANLSVLLTLHCLGRL